MTSPTSTANLGPDGFRGDFRTDRLARELYAEGAGIARCVPAAVAVPADADDLSMLVRWAKRHGHALIPRGSGSGMAAGAVGPGIIVDVSRFNTIGPVRRDAAGGAHRIRVGAGALRGAIDQAARAVGLRFPVDPSSGAFCTIGGMVGANAAGARTLRFGATRPWVTGLHCVFDDGSTAWIRRDETPPRDIAAVVRLMHTLDALRAHADLASLVHAGVRKESSGYGIAAALAPGGHLIDVLVGSEGTLAIFVEVELALIPIAGATATVLATFASLEDATSCAVDATAVGASACELLDKTFLRIAATDGPTGIADDADAVLLIEVEGDDPGAARVLLERVTACCSAHHATRVETALDAEAEHALWELRHAASPILSRLAPKLRSLQFIEDSCVPSAMYPAYVRGVREILDRHQMLGVIFGHAGDAHAHVNPLVDVTRSDWRATVEAVLSEVVALTASLGGTLAGEHGDGRLRASLLTQVWTAEALAAFANIKAAGDPSGILNPGCKVALPGDAAIGVLRHDPDAEPLLPEARVALDAIERDRAWSRFRLDYAVRP